MVDNVVVMSYNSPKYSVMDDGGTMAKFPFLMWYVYSRGNQEICFLRA